MIAVVAVRAEVARPDVQLDVAAQYATGRSAAARHVQNRVAEVRSGAASGATWMKDAHRHSLARHQRRRRETLSGPERREVRLRQGQGPRARDQAGDGWWPGGRARTRQMVRLALLTNDGQDQSVRP